MINKDTNICFESKIWDLHIHTCACDKSSGDFSKLSVDDYISLLDNTFRSHKDLSMISFTDHNAINLEVYKAAFAKKWDLTIIIGIEVDIYLNADGERNNDIKHVIFYFDPDKFDLVNHSSAINAKIGGKPILFQDFVEYLLTDIKVPFLISPHFMKQDKRGIEYYWNGEPDRHAFKYIDQLFCFWETSSVANIQRAEQFLLDYANGKRQSIISFSDSHDISRLETYLNNPPQYFNALPSFSGIRLVGSDSSRIMKERFCVKKENAALYIGKVIQGDRNVVYFSPKLNSIIGGRGMGKSLLLDGICYCLDPAILNSIDSLSDRIPYLNKLNFQAFDLGGNPLSNHHFLFEYFNQGYVLNLFKNNDDDAIGSVYFKNEFDKIEKYNTDLIRNSIIQDIAYIKLTKETLNENLASICDKIVKLDSESTDIHIGSKNEIKTIDYKEYESFIAALKKPAITPSELKDNEKVIKAYNDLFKTIEGEIRTYNETAIINSFHHYLYKKYGELISKKSEEKKTKNNIIKLLKANLRNQLIPVCNRVSRINAMISNDGQYSQEKSTSADGFDNHKFVFSRELKVQNLIEYLHSVFIRFFDKTKVRNLLNVDRDSLGAIYELIKGYCYFPDKLLLQSKTMKELEKVFDDLEGLSIECVDEIYYVDGEQKTRLRDVSPGTKANLLMEYIVFKDSSIPLLIDQPEDNIDNKTIYSDLTKWFSRLKDKRQVIVVTHDANIVINSDSENVVVCEQTSSNVFDYKNGALEYADILDDASTILDGGREAIERRLMKYGEDN